MQLVVKGYARIHPSLQLFSHERRATVLRCPRNNVFFIGIMICVLICVVLICVDTTSDEHR
jgi:hypothetical protein